MKPSKGVRRLAVLLGAIGSMVWLTFVMVVSKGFAEVQAPWGWFFLVVIAGISFLIPFLLVHGIGWVIAWVIRGFRESHASSVEWFPSRTYYFPTFLIGQCFVF